MKIHKEGTGILLALFSLLFMLNLILFHWSGRCTVFYVSSILSLIIFLCVLNFFRSPFRRFPFDSEGLVIAPADGTVVVIEETGEYEDLRERRIQISVFMSIFNVHANWFPVNGVVKHVSHRSGRFMAAYLPKSSQENERSSVVITTAGGINILVRQIAGAMARRIVTYAKVGEPCRVDEHLGFIKFGSRVDVFIPTDSEILVEMGQKVTGNQTPLARLKVKSSKL